MVSLKRCRTVCESACGNTECQCLAFQSRPKPSVLLTGSPPLLPCNGSYFMVIWLLEIRSVCKERTCEEAQNLTQQNSPHTPAPTMAFGPPVSLPPQLIRPTSLPLPLCLLASLLHFLSVFAPNCGAQTGESRLFRYSHGRPLRLPHRYPPPRPRSNDKTLRLPHRKPTVAARPSQFTVTPRRPRITLS